MEEDIFSFINEIDGIDELPIQSASLHDQLEKLIETISGQTEPNVSYMERMMSKAIADAMDKRANIMPDQIIYAIAVLAYHVMTGLALHSPLKEAALHKMSHALDDAILSAARQYHKEESNG